MKTNETNYKNAIKSNIILFLSYGIVIGFIFLLLVIIVKCALHDISNTFLSLTLSCISAILIYHLLHFICKSSTLETFKKINIDTESSTKFIKKMNLVFTICIVFSILFSIGYLVMDKLVFTTAIDEAYSKYEFISYELAQNIANNISREYQNSFLSKISSTIIIELALVTSFFSLIPYQKKLLSKYNKT